MWRVAIKIEVVDWKATDRLLVSLKSEPGKQRNRRTKYFLKPAWVI